MTVAADGCDARLVGAVRSDDRHGLEVSSVEHAEAGRLVLAAPARRLGEAGRQLQREPGKGAVCGRIEASAGAGGARVDR